MSLALELAIQDPAGMRIAREAGAARVELTQALALGGLTPSQATIEITSEVAGEDGPEVHALVRSRAGDFHYDADEIALMARDVRLALAAGAHGVVVGCQSDDGALNREGLARLVDAAAGAPVTLHRVIDTTPDPIAALRTARELGIRRVLTSGGASRAVDGVDVLRALVAEADGGIEVMAGSGITASDVVAIAATGVDAVHFSAKRTVTADGGVRLGSASDGVGGYETTDRDAALAVVAALAPVVA
ncbi:copper homeostasis protein CutC [Microbacterium esteraromaticum]|uniref:copper homeostasis protein CutC n=1 Tax=Microbacterium esteraromaticum TaxID=57043 RepID=UPI0023674B79|nr:copper homeostasis protein CutC [Microbacterium esteraromaticum]WDH78526.1 copper homeostasis protein CutC [Microbacterium esteraromaticum]